MLVFGFSSFAVSAAAVAAAAVVEGADAPGGCRQGLTSWCGLDMASISIRATVPR